MKNYAGSQLSFVGLNPYRSSCSADLCPMALCRRAGLCFAELAPDGGPLYSKIHFNNILESVYYNINNEKSYW